MVILSEDGEKYACEACLKGHRVSSCHHRDRPLFHVNKKGRPVSQCLHCRGLRKARAAHVKCVCAEHGISKDAASTDKASDDHRCGCATGHACTCALKREPCSSEDLTRTVAHNLTHRRVQSHGKPVMLNRRSDSAVPRQSPGLHPPLHRMNNAAHEYGMPYTIKRFTTSTPNIDLQTHRSTDNLPLSMFGPGPTLPSQQPDLASSLPADSHMTSRTSNNSPAPRSASVSMLNSFQAPFDPRFMNDSLSPANPARYSLNDFSTFSWSNLGPESYNDQSQLSSAVDNYPSEWPVFAPELSSYPPSNTGPQTPQRSSVISLDQPGLTHSPSNTASDAGSAAVQSEAGSSSMGRPPLTIHPSWMDKTISHPPPLETVPGSFGTMSSNFNYQANNSNGQHMRDFYPKSAPSVPPAYKAESVTGADPLLSADINSDDPFSSEPFDTSIGSLGMVPEYNTDVTSANVNPWGPGSSDSYFGQQSYDEGVGNPIYGNSNWN